MLDIGAIASHISPLGLIGIVALGVALQFFLPTKTWKVNLENAIMITLLAAVYELLGHGFGFWMSAAVIALLHGGGYFTGCMLARSLRKSA